MPREMNRILLFFSLFALCSFSSCSSHEQEIEFSRVYSPLKETKRVEDLEPYVSELEILPMGSDSLSILGVKKVLASSSDKLCLLAGGAVYVMSKTGDDIMRVGAIGRGPGEYVQINDIAINLEGTELWCLEYRNILLRYDLNSGRFLGNTDLGTKYGQSEAIVPMSDGLFSLYYANPYTNDLLNENVSFNCLKVFDMDGKIKNESMPWTDYNFDAAFSVAISCSDSNVCVLTPGLFYPNLVFENGIVKERVLIDFGQKNVPYRYMFRDGKNPMLMISELFRSDYYKCVSSFFYSQEDVYFRAFGKSSSSWNFIIPESGTDGIRWVSIGMITPPISAVGVDSGFLLFPYDDYGEISADDELDPLKRCVLKRFGPPSEPGPCLIKVKFDV